MSEFIDSEIAVDLAVERLDAITYDDPEAAHGEADDVLLSCVPPEVAAAYIRVKDRQRWWATA